MMVFNVDGNVTDLFLGRQGENLATQLVFGIPEDLQQYAAFVYVLRNGDDVAYPASNVVVSGGVITWTITSIETQNYGAGEVQVRFMDGEVIVKTLVFRSFVARSIDMDAGDAPDPYQTWLDTLVGVAAEVQIDARDAREAKDAAETAQGKAEDAQQAAEQAQDAAETSEQNAKTSEENAEASALTAEAWAVGEKNGVPVPQTDETYNNNAKHYAALAEQGAERSGYVFFDVNDADGCMYVTSAGSIDEDVSFEVNENIGILEVIYA